MSCQSQHLAQTHWQNQDTERGKKHHHLDVQEKNKSERTDETGEAMLVSYTCSIACQVICLPLIRGEGWEEQSFTEAEEVLCLLSAVSIYDASSCFEGQLCLLSPC